MIEQYKIGLIKFLWNIAINNILINQYKMQH